MVEPVIAESFDLNFYFQTQKSPITAFDKLKDIFQAFSAIDKVYLSSIDSSLVSGYVLQGLEFGSIKSKIAQLIREIPDEAIKELEWKKVIGHFLVKAKYLILKHLEGEKQIDSAVDLASLAKKIEVEKSKILGANKYIINEINTYSLLFVMEPFVNIASQLNDDERIEYVSPAGKANVTNALTFNRAKILWELGDKQFESETTEILKIKKIDFLSNNSLWSFKRDNKPIDAKVVDQEWLNRYHAREYPLMPEDSLKVKLKTTYTNRSDGTVVKPTYEVIKVLEIIYPPENPSSLF